MNFIIYWAIICALIVIIIGIVKFKTFIEFEKGWNKFITWWSLRLWFPVLFLITFIGTIFYKDKWIRFWKYVYNSLFVFDDSVPNN